MNPLRRTLATVFISVLLLVSALPLHAQTQESCALRCINTVINGVDFSKLTGEQISAYLGSLSPEQLGGFIGQLDPQALTIFLGTVPAATLDQIVGGLPQEVLDPILNFLPAEGRAFLVSSLSSEAALSKLGLTPEDREAFLLASQELADANASGDPALMALALVNLAQLPGGDALAAGILAQTNQTLDGVIGGLSPEDVSVLFSMADGASIDFLTQNLSEESLNGVIENLDEFAYASILSEADPELALAYADILDEESLAYVAGLMYDGENLATLVESYDGLIDLIDLEALPDYALADFVTELDDADLSAAVLESLGYADLDSFLGDMDEELLDLYMAAEAFEEDMVGEEDGAGDESDTEDGAGEEGAGDESGTEDGAGEEGAGDESGGEEGGEEGSDE